MSRLSLSLDLSLPIKPPIPTPRITLPPGVWAQALHDWESPPGWDPKRRIESLKPAYWREDLGYPVPRSLYRVKDKLKDWKGFPEMVPGNPRVGVKLTKNIQFFWVKLLALEKYKILLVEKPGQTFESEYNRLLNRDQRAYIGNAFRGLTKSYTAFTNQRGTDNCRDYVNRVNLGESEDPMLWENTTGGALLRLESTQIHRQGYKVLTLKTSDYNIWKNWTPIDHPGYFTDSMNSSPLGFDGIPTLKGPWRSDRFHYLGGPPVWVPVISNTGYFYIKQNRLRILQQGEPFPPRSINP